MFVKVEPTADRFAFDLLCNEKPYKIFLTYLPKKNRYALSCSSLETAYIHYDQNNEETKDNLIRYLNRTQSFRIIPESPGVIYAHNRFFKPRLAYVGNSSADKFELLKVFHPIDELSDIGSEKGKKVRRNGVGWEEGCLFDFIDYKAPGKAMGGRLKNVKHMICDDMNTEAADFIAANNAEVYFIHAKAFARAKQSSASAFHEVCGQALKNLEFLSPLSIQKPSNLNRWEKSWKSSGVEGEVKTRFRAGKGDANEAWDNIQGKIRDPSISLQVWIVFGKGFSKQLFKKNLNRKTPPPEFVQIVFLVQSTWSAVQSMGAELKIFCSP